MFSQSRKLSPVLLSTRENGSSFCVLGIDRAVAGATGYGIVESDGRRCRMLRFGAIRPAARGDEDRSASTHLCHVHELITKLIREYAPHEVAIESVFTALNMKTALRLAEMRGVVLLAAAQAGIASFSYSPREVKAAVAGYGHAGKEQVQQMVRATLGLGETPEPPDAADALAVALCHVQMAEARRRLAVQSGILDIPRGSSRRRSHAAAARIPSPR
jgi:crossover junction endodeoxyribonuclease RuvC